ncbi:hypothetical protein KEM52_005375 [Ascosphaera acerosa]|nr:hypothetical protein KEM52_005375 [Ascosphaera acerosa]
MVGIQRDLRDVAELQDWAALAQTTFNGIKVVRDHAVQDGKGSAVLASEDVPSPDGSRVLMKVPRDLVLSRDRVREYAKSDATLKEILDCLGEDAQTPRGAILTYLLVNHTYASPQFQDAADKHPTQWTDYLRFMPAAFSLPTFYNFQEREMLSGTSLDMALYHKLESLEAEFNRLMEATRDIDWCQRCWWGMTGHAMLNDWVLVDAIYRSRALELPGVGEAMVPCVDMANHAAGDETVALYETDDDGNALLLLREGKALTEGEEVTITYGDEKGASEMVFSYGFLPSNIQDAGTIFLDLVLPPSDPLRVPKKACSKVAPGVRISRDKASGTVVWESQFVWWVLLTQDDGLDFQIEKGPAPEDEDGEEVEGVGETQVRIKFKEHEVEPTHILEDLLRKDELWPVYELRALVIIQNRVRAQLQLLKQSDASASVWDAMVAAGTIRRDVHATAMRLRQLERTLLESADAELEDLVSIRKILLSAERAARLVQSADRHLRDSRNAPRPTTQLSRTI